MNKLYSLIIFAVALTFTSCKDWTEVENIVPENSSAIVKDDAYYADLRAWKDEMFLERKHKFLFSWWGWSIPENEAVTNEKLLEALPDSTGLVLVWCDYVGQSFMYSDRYARDMASIKKKGTRVVFTFKPQSLGTGCTDGNMSQGLKDKIASLAERHGFADLISETTYWPTVSLFSTSDHRDSVYYDTLIMYYGDAMLERMDTLNADGIDFDYEPDIEPVTNNFWTETDKFNDLVVYMSQFIGPCATTEEGRKKMFIIDGEINDVYYKNLHRFSYFFPQTYSASTQVTTAGNYLSNTYCLYVVNAYANSACRLTSSELLARIAPSQMNTGNFTDVNGTVWSDKWMGLATYVPLNSDGVRVHSAGVGRFMGFGDYYDAEYPYETYPWARSVINWANQVKNEYDALDYDEIEQRVKDEYLDEFIQNNWWPITPYEDPTTEYNGE